MNMPRRSDATFGLLVIAAAAWLCVAATVAPAAEFEVVPERVEAASWIALPPRYEKSPLRGHSISIIIRSGYCLGEPKPETARVKVIERPKTKRRRFKSAVLIAFVRHPSFERPVRPPNTEKVIYTACAGVGLDLHTWVKLKRPPADLFVFDGRYQPPQRRWPRLHR